MLAGGRDAGRRKENGRPVKLGVKQKVSSQTNVVTSEVQGQTFAPSFTL